MMAVAMQENSDQWLNQIRDQVRSAFRGPDVRMPSVMGAMITRESKDVETSRRPPKGMTKEERRSWYATSWNREVQASPSRNSGQSRPIEYKFPDGWVLRRVREIHAESARHGRILKHLYQPNQGSQHAEWLAWHLWGEYQMDGLNAKTRNVISGMFHLQLREMASPFGWVGIMHEPWRHFELSRDQWKRTYRDHWVNVRDILSRLDEEALWKVYE